ncbi:MAG: AMP-binding protein [Gammaproteobacteria bacterium]|nr:AMP-binding protein [Gammaproteobacteria bacterium]
MKMPMIRSRVPGLIWPGLPGPYGDAHLALLWQLERSQWWRADVLHAHQLRQLAVVLAHAAKNVPFYRAKLAGMDLAACATSEGWAGLPILTRSDIQAAGAQLRAEAIPREHGRFHEIQTSGSTGKPIRAFGSDITSFFWNVLTLRGHLWHKHDFSGKLASIRVFDEGVGSPPKGMSVPAWGHATDVAWITGPGALLNLATASVSQQAEWLQREAPDYLLTHPSNLAALVREMGPRPAVLPNLREVWTIAESLDANVRRFVEEEWQLRVVDTYSSRECGYLATQCPMSDHYHVHSESVLVEVLDDAGQPVKPGEVGRVLISTLHNYATPLLRYEIGDYAEVGAPCPCGRGLPTLSRIVGRQRNMLTLPDGEKRWPRCGYDQFMDIVPVRQLRLVQRSLHTIDAEIVTERPLTESESAALVGIIHEALGHPFEIRLDYVAEIPRGPGGKFEEFLSAIDRASESTET